MNEMLQTAIIICLIVVLIANFGIPGYPWSPASRVAGYWATHDGDLYEIRRQSFDSRSLAITGRGKTVPGRLTGLRWVCAAGDCGFLSLDGRSLIWKTVTWYRQGV